MKVFGLNREYYLIRFERSRIVVCYGYKEVDELHATWHEICFYNKQYQQVGMTEIKNGILNDINTRTNERIVSGFVWKGKSVWLSTENQFNFKAAFDVAVQTEGANLPVKFKIGEEADGTPIYHTFEELEELSDFYTQAMQHIQSCLNEGWEEKDSIHWSDYERRINRANESENISE